MEKIIWVVCFVFFLGTIAIAGDEVPVEVPPCPEEYKDGLIP